MRTVEQRAILAAASEIKRAERKQAVKARVKPVVPIAKGQRQPRVREPLYLAWVRRLDCVSCAVIVLGGYMSPSAPRGGGTQAAHLRMSIPGRPNPGMQTKADDRYVTPLCASCHLDQHSGSERDFWDELEIDPFAFCDALHAAYEAGQDGNAVVRHFAEGRA